jgi:hypothetical protein
MLTWLLPIAIAALLLWFFWPKPRRATPAPEDDVTTPIDREELERAERELRESRGSRSLDEAEEDDWGPGAG